MVRIYNMQTISIDIPKVIEMESLIPPIINGTTAPPDMAIIIRPEISLLRVGYFSTVIAKTNGKILATDNPIINTNPHDIKGDEIIIIQIKHNKPDN